MPRDGSGTRTLIQRTAMRLFVEQGYDKTSLREIAEAVGVTKAALYYHFPTKVEIVRAAMAEYVDAVDAILADAAALPGGAERNEAVVDRALALFGGEGSLALRFSQANPTVVAREDFGTTHVSSVQRLVRLLGGEHPTADAELRATLTFGALLLGSVGGDALGSAADPDELRTAARALALELLAPLG